MPHRVTELHNIMPISNISLVLMHGILSHERAAKLPHSDVSMVNVQDKRERVQVPGGLKLHQYANLYFDARNPMMYKRKSQAESLCILCISVEVLSIQNVVISDQNAASDYVRFYPANCLSDLNFDQIYAPDWRHPDDQIVEWRHKSAKCAEVLVPYAIGFEYVTGAYVVSETTKNDILAAGFAKPVVVKPGLFFR